MRRALLIEDERVAARVAMSALRSLGFAVERVGSARGARAAWRLGLFALVVADVQIPESEVSDDAASGLDVVAWMRARGEKARVIVWTADDVSTHQLRAAELDATIIAKDGTASAKLLSAASQV